MANNSIKYLIYTYNQIKLIPLIKLVKNYGIIMFLSKFSSDYYLLILLTKIIYFTLTKQLFSSNL